MQIGAMNHPQTDVLAEIRWMAELGLDFLDLTLEPPAAAAWRVDVGAIRAALREHGLGVVGHTAYYLPIASPFESVRRAAVSELLRCLAVFAELGARWMNVHPDRYSPLDLRARIVQRNLESLRELLAAGREAGVGIMVENVPGDFNDAGQLADLLEPLPELGLHLDIGHANLQVRENATEEILRAYGPRLRHVHLHDNKGGSADLHLPLGTGTLEVSRYLGALRRAGYDGTITIEAFTPDRHYLAYSRDVLRALWEKSE